MQNQGGCHVMLSTERARLFNCATIWQDKHCYKWSSFSTKLLSETYPHTASHPLRISCQEIVPIKNNDWKKTH